MNDRMAIRKTPGAFTLVELLVVIGVIAILISLLLPAMQRVRQKARDVACASQLRQLGVGIAAYAASSGGWPPEAIVQGNLLYALAPGSPQARRPGLVPDTRSWPNTWNGLGKLFAQGYVPSARVFWCASEDAPQKQFASQHGDGVRNLVPGAEPTRTVRTDYWYRFGVSYQSDPDKPCEKMSLLRGPLDAMVMCAGERPSNPSLAQQINWFQLHGNRGFNVVFSDGHVVWYDYNYFIKPDAWGDSHGNRYRADMSYLTLIKTAALLDGRPTINGDYK